MKTFTILDRAAILAGTQPDWLIENILPQDAFATLYGAPDSFKSFVGLDAACSVATGLPFLGMFPVKLTGDVVYVYAEGGRNFSKRLRAWEEHHKCQATRLRGVASPVNMLSTEPERLAENIATATVNPVLILLDTLARCFGGGDENSTQDMGAFVRGCDALRGTFPNCTLLAVHHTGWAKRQRPRGARALEGAVDTLLECSRKGTSPDFTFGMSKQKDDEEIKPIPCRAIKVPAARSLVVEAINMAANKPGETNDNLALRMLRDAAAAGLSANELFLATRINEHTLKDVRERLQDAGLVECRSRRWYATAASSLAA